MRKWTPYHACISSHNDQRPTIKLQILHVSLTLITMDVLTLKNLSNWGLFTIPSTKKEQGDGKEPTAFYLDIRLRKKDRRCIVSPALAFV